MQEEQEEIIKDKEKCGEERALNWADTKKMPMTTRVIQETLRVASILSFTFREAVEDVEFNGKQYSMSESLSRIECLHLLFELPKMFTESLSLVCRIQQDISFQKDGK